MIPPSRLSFVTRLVEKLRFGLCLSKPQPFIVQAFHVCPRVPHAGRIESQRTFPRITRKIGRTSNCITHTPLGLAPTYHTPVHGTPYGNKVLYLLLQGEFFSSSPFPQFNVNVFCRIFSSIFSRCRQSSSFLSCYPFSHKSWLFPNGEEVHLMTKVSAPLPAIQEARKRTAATPCRHPSADGKTS